MRPLRLTMQAFGPYADRQVVDFTAALDAGLFGIYGPTGAGKSSIFNAIAFALFGESARGDQDLPSMRSDHASPDVISEVELIFDVGAKRYSVRRRPQQSRPKQRGAGETKEAHTAWLFDVSDMSPDDISESNPGKPLAEKHVSAVAEAMERVLGYNASHFRQIVLLPQGQFEKFLVAKTDERLKILRELFDVSLYQKLSKKLKEEAATAAGLIQNQRTALNALLAHEQCASLEDLQTAAMAAETQSETLKATVTEADTAAQTAARLLGEASQIDRRFQDLEAASAALAVPQGQQSEIDQKAQSLAGARAAQSLAGADQAVEAAQRRVGVALLASNQAKEVAAAANLAAVGAATALQRERDRETETQNLVERRNELKRHRQTFDGAAAQQRALDGARTGATVAETAFAAAQRSHQSLIGDRTKKQDELRRGEEAATIRATLTAGLAEKRRAHEVAQQREKAISDLKAAETIVRAVEKGVADAKAAEERAELSYEEAEARLTVSQAIHLAEKLVDGEACPVCGSHEHPAPASGDAASAGLDAAFRAARESLVRARKAHGEARERLAGTRSAVRERKATLDALALAASPAADLALEVKAVEQQLKALGVSVDVQVLRNAVLDLDKRVEAAATVLETARSMNDSAKTRHALATQAVDSALASIPSELRTSGALDAATTQVDGAIRKREQALQAAISAERTASEAAVATTRDSDNAASALTTANAEVAGERVQFGEQLATADLTDEQYRLHKSNIPRMASLQQTIEAHGQRLAAAQDRLEQAQRSIEGVERPDLAGLQARHTELIAARQTAATTEADIRSKAMRLRGLINKLGADLAALKTAEDVYAPLGVVSDLLSGVNAAKVDLEAFAMATMFDRVLEAANLRLGPMSRQRYTLQREQEGKGGGKRGLGIVVHDLYTGRARATSTLSGGESFQAALSLALGLSDVVEALSGGTRLDMIFIDEGFGSLDGNSLEEALQILQDLVGQSRVLGLISHIEIVQQAIPIGFQIEKTMTGSAVRQRHAM